MNLLKFLRGLFNRRLEPMDETHSATQLEKHPLNGTADEAAYRGELAGILADHTESAVRTLRDGLALMPTMATKVTVMIHPAQDPDGSFSVIIHLEGPNLHVLNKAIDPHRSLFVTRHTPTGFDPLLPMFDPFDSAFEVNDVIVDVATDWIEAVWRAAEGVAITVPAVVSGEDGYGTSPSRTLPTAVMS